VNPKWKLSKTVAGTELPREPKYVREYSGKDPEHLAFLHTLPCAVKRFPLRYATRCAGELQAHHSTVGRGKSQRTDDRNAFPLCLRHHLEEFHERKGTFLGWTKAQRRRWQNDMSAAHAPKAEPSRAGGATR